jgi:hypothetical protein
VPLRVFRILAAASRITANVVLLTKAAWVHRPQIGQLLSNCFDLILDLFWVHADIIAELSAFVNKKMTSLRKKFNLSPRLVFWGWLHSL